MKVFFIILLPFLLHPLAGEKDANETSLLNEKFRLNGTATQTAFGKSKDVALSTTVRLIRND